MSNSASGKIDAESVQS